MRAELQRRRKLADEAGKAAARLKREAARAPEERRGGLATAARCYATVARETRAELRRLAKAGGEQ